MSTYSGPATVVTDGAEYQVTAHVTVTVSGGLKEWSGSLEAENEEAAWTIYQAEDAKLRISGDRAGAFISVRYSPPATDLDIQGSGPAPFGN